MRRTDFAAMTTSRPLREKNRREVGGGPSPSFSGLRGKVPARFRELREGGSQEHTHLWWAGPTPVAAVHLIHSARAK